MAAGTILHGISDTADAAGYTLRESGERFERTGHGDAGGQADSGDPGGGPETDTVFTSRLRTQPKGEPYDLADSFL